MAHFQIASRLEAISSRLEAIAFRLEAIASRFVAHFQNLFYLRRVGQFPGSNAVELGAVRPRFFSLECLCDEKSFALCFLGRLLFLVACEAQLV